MRVNIETENEIGIKFSVYFNVTGESDKRKDETATKSKGLAKGRKLGKKKGEDRNRYEGK